MNEFLSKIENFLFDIIGLMLPGVIALLLIVLPAYLSGLQHLNHAQIKGSNFLAFLHFISFTISDLVKYKPGYLVFGLLMSAYIVGHLLKVTSIVFYDFLTALFDKLINRICASFGKWLSKKIIELINWVTASTFQNTKAYGVIKDFYKPVKRHIFSTFQFKSPDYVPDNDPIKNETIALINKRLNTTFPPVWYSLYKIGTVTLMQEGIKNLSNFFLSKYNLYRSLSLLSLFAFFYYLVFFKTTAAYVTTDLRHFKTLILWLMLALWYTFHSKYKRYWTLCGNETLMSLYYFLNKKQLNS